MASLSRAVMAQIGGDDRRADRDLDGRGPKRSRVVEDHADGQERHAGRVAHGPLGPENEPRRAGPQRQQDRLRLRGAFGKDQDDAACAQRLDRRGEHLVVLPRIVPGLDAPVDGHGAEQMQRRTDQRVTKERRLGEHRDRARDGRDDQHRVDERIVVVGGDDDPAALGDPLPADHVDPPVEEPQEQPDQRPGDPIGRAPATRSI